MSLLPISPNKSQRNYGIELLRIVAMSMIVIHHLCLDIQSFTGSWGAKFLNAYFYYSTECCVDLFALITGYIMYQKRIRFSRLIEILIQSLFYFILLVTVFKLFGFQIGISNWPNNNAWRYISAYFGMMFFVPVINCAFEKLTFLQIEKFAFFLFLVFSVIATILYKNHTFAVRGGFSVIWLICCYCIGYGVRAYKENKTKLDKTVKHCFLVVFATQILFAVAIVGEMFNFPYLNHLNKHILQYNSPIIILESIAILLLFATMKINYLQAKKAITFFAPLTFGVYLIHESRSVNIQKLVKTSVTFTDFLINLIISFTAIYLLCSIIDYLRSKLFELCKIKSFSTWLEEKIDKTTERLLQYINS